MSEQRIVYEHRAGAGKMSPESFLQILYLSRGLGFDPIFARIKFSTA